MSPHRPTGPRLALAAVALALAACGGGRARYVPLDREADGDADAAEDAETGGDADVVEDAEVDEDADADVELDAEADAEVPSLPRGAVIVLAEVDGFDGFVEASALVRFRFRRPMSWCGYLFGFYGDCTTFAPNSPSCEPACGEEEVCEWNEDCSAATCRPALDAAELFDAGEVSIDGATHQPEISCVRSAEGGSYACDLDAERDLWEGGDSIRASAPGRTFPAFSAEVTAPSRLEVLTDTSGWSTATLDGSAEVILEWDPTTPATAVEISVATPEASLSCLSADSGSFTIPAEALAALGAAARYDVAVVRSNAGIANEARDGEVKVYAETVGLSLSLTE